MADEWMTMAHVCKLANKSSRRTTALWLKRMGIEAYRHPQDARFNVYKKSDIERALNTPRRKRDEAEQR